MDFEYSISDVLYEFTDWLFSLLTSFRRFLLLNDTGGFKRFFFVAIPLFFALFEAIFDWLIPTFLDLRPMGIKRLFVGRFEKLKTPELKAYQPIRMNEYKSNFKFKFDKFRFSKHKDIKNNLNFSTADTKKYILMYQQRYNTTPNPLQLKRFIYQDGNSNLNQKKARDTVIGAADLAKGISKNMKKFAEWVRLWVWKLNHQDQNK